MGREAGYWEMRWVPSGIEDQGSSHTWALGPVEVDIDIDSPGNDRCLNQNLVKIFGAADFDVSSINIDTMAFGGEGPDRPVPQCTLDYLNGDIHLDIACRFIPGTAVASLSGEMLDGSTFAGSAPVCAAR